jgi:hypothetical protein
MNEMVERVARALCEQDTEWRPFEYYRDEFVSMARAVIGVMRTPTEAMRQAAFPDMPHASLEALRVWQAMIDAAKKD